MLPQTAGFVQRLTTARQPLHTALDLRSGDGEVSFPVWVVCKKCISSLADEQKSGQIIDQSLVSRFNSQPWQFEGKRGRSRLMASDS